MDRASSPDPEAFTIDEDEPTSTDDNTDGGVILPSRVSKAASSTALFATVRAWLERIEQESPLASEAKYGAGAPSSPNITANSPHQTTSKKRSYQSCRLHHAVISDRLTKLHPLATQFDRLYSHCTFRRPR